MMRPVQTTVVGLSDLSEGKSINSWGIASFQEVSYTTNLSYPPTTTSKLLDYDTTTVHEGNE